MSYTAAAIVGLIPPTNHRKRAAMANKAAQGLTAEVVHPDITAAAAAGGGGRRSNAGSNGGSSRKRKSGGGASAADAISLDSDDDDCDSEWCLHWGGGVWKGGVLLLRLRLFCGDCLDAVLMLVCTCG
jgi:hypothetical protein